jgi:hypothetical protein
MACEVGVDGLLRPISCELRQQVAFGGSDLVFVNALLLCRRHRGPLSHIKGTYHARRWPGLPRFPGAMHVIHRLDELSTPRHEVVQGGFTGALGLFQRREGGAGDPDGPHIRAPHRTPGRDITCLPTKAGAGPALIADDERESIAHRAPYLHVGDEIADTFEREIDRWCALAQWTPPVTCRLRPSANAVASR